MGTVTVMPGLVDAHPEFLATPVLPRREQVETQLRAAILNGTIPVGAKLPSEHALATSFNVSRATVREALRPLIDGGSAAMGPSSTGGLYVQRVNDVAPVRGGSRTTRRDRRPGVDHPGGGRQLPGPARGTEHGWRPVTARRSTWTPCCRSSMRRAAPPTTPRSYPS